MEPQVIRYYQQTLCVEAFSRDREEGKGRHEVNVDVMSFELTSCYCERKKH